MVVEFFEGQIFSDFAEFSTAFAQYCEENYVLFVTKQSVRTKNPLVRESHVYDSVVYRCKQSDDKRNRTTKSRGIRPNQSTFSVGCQAMFRLNRIEKTDAKSILILKNFVPEHNGHEVNSEVYSSYPEIRRKNLQVLKEKAPEILARNPNIRVTDLHQLILKATNKIIHYSDVCNFLYQLKKDENVLRAIEQLRQDPEIQADISQMEECELHSVSSGEDITGNVEEKDILMDMFMSKKNKKKTKIRASQRQREQAALSRKQFQSHLQSIKKPLGSRPRPITGTIRQQPAPKNLQSSPDVENSSSPHVAVQQFKKAQLFFTEMSDYLSGQSESLFETKLNQLAQIYQAWISKKEIITIEVDSTEPLSARPNNHISGHFSKANVSFQDSLPTGDLVPETSDEISSYGQYSVVIKTEPADDSKFTALQEVAANELVVQEASEAETPKRRRVN